MKQRITFYVENNIEFSYINEKSEYEIGKWSSPFDKNKEIAKIVKELKKDEFCPPLVLKNKIISVEIKNIK